MLKHSDWLQGGDEEKLTEEEMVAIWERLAKSDLRSKRINLACRGDDGFEINAIISDVITVIGVGIVFRICDATLIDQEEREKNLLKYQPENLPEARYVILDNPGFVPEFRETSIVLSGGGRCVDKTGEISLGGCLCIGFIYI